MKSLIFLLLAAAISWHFMDIEAVETVPSIVAPIAFIGFLCALAGWLALRIGATAHRSGDAGFADWDGDGGCGD